MQNEIKQGKRPGNPLHKRVWRDCLRDWKRYLMIFIMLVVTIGFVSGMYVANNSMLSSLDEAPAKFNREDGHFELSAAMDESLASAVGSGKMADIAAVLRERAYDEARDEVENAVRDAVEENVRSAVADTIQANVEAAVDEQLASAAAMGMEVTDEQRDTAIKEALDAAMSENYESAVNTALEQAYESDDYSTALSDAMTEAKKKIDEKIDEEYGKLAESYGLDDEFTEVRVSTYELFFRNADETISTDSGYKGTIRVYDERDSVNMYDLLDGRAPASDSEIIIDRMHADNVGIKVGDTIYAGRTAFTVVGLAAFTDYTTLYESNTDTMFDALTFNVAMTTHAGFARITAPVHYNYAFIYETKPSDTYAEKNMSDNFLKVLITQTAAADPAPEIKDYVPAYANHAITFAPNDMGSDKAMGGVLLYILTAVLAFIFAVTASATVEKEASVIGTLRASGYTKSELVRYYMSGPLIVVTAAAIVGNILGYTCFKYVVVAMYYNSYSLPNYETLWTPEAFVRTTIVPIVLMLVINFIVIVRMLQLPPLRFLRHDLKKKKRRKAVRLPKWRFFARFRMRVFLQNIPNYLMMFVGISFVMLLLSMAVGMPETLDYYKGRVADMMFAKDQVILISTEDSDGNTIVPDNAAAERFSVNSLIFKSEIVDEEVSIYGIIPGSSYVELPDSYYEEAGISSGAAEAVISGAFAKKYGLSKGDTVTLSEKFENRTYDLHVYDVSDYEASIAVFMSDSIFNSTFDKPDGYFSGYMSDDPVTGIDEKYIAKEITPEDTLKMANQLDHSMGSYMLYFQYVCVIVAAIMMYLLTKIIIEKNERAISMVKILGYDNKEIASLYMITTCIVVFLSEFPAMFIGYAAMKAVWLVLLKKLGGYFAFVMPAEGFVKEFLLVFAAYLVITVCDFIRIRRIPKVLALKNVE